MGLLCATGLAHPQSRIAGSHRAHACEWRVYLDELAGLDLEGTAGSALGTENICVSRGVECFRRAAAWRSEGHAGGGTACY